VSTHIKPRAISCADCGETLGRKRARTIIHGQLHCDKCTYLHDYPEKEVVSSKRSLALPLQAETLFLLPLGTKSEAGL
jgi:DNA-directed RNA polymerase subunit M/transcription elongation factor TFIIS